jgi:hypothetical protein
MPMRGALSAPGRPFPRAGSAYARHRRRSGVEAGDQSLAQLDRAAITAGNAFVGGSHAPAAPRWCGGVGLGSADLGGA